MEILNDFVMPVNAAARNGKGSKYLTAEQQIVVNGLKKGQAVILPPVPGITGSFQRANVLWYANKYCNIDKTKIFAAAVIDGKGVALKLVDVKLPTPEAPEAPAEAGE